jgi:hypothetical protein
MSLAEIIASLMNTMIQREVRRIMRTKRTTDVDARRRSCAIERGAGKAQSQKARVIEVQAKVNGVLDTDSSLGQKRRRRGCIPRRWYGSRGVS